MPNPIDACLLKVREAEVDCERSALAAQNAWADLKTQAKDAATPWRIVGVGAVLGFLAGRGNADGTATAKLFGSMAQSLVTMLTAGATAGVAASAAADAAAEATVDATAEAVEEVAEANALKAAETV